MHFYTPPTVKTVTISSVLSVLTVLTVLTVSTVQTVKRLLFQLFPQHISMIFYESLRLPMDFNDFPLDSVNWPVKTDTKQLKQLNCPVQTVQKVGIPTVSTVSTDFRSNPIKSVTIRCLFRYFSVTISTVLTELPVENS